MTMNRRSALKNLLIVTGGVLFLPSCKGDTSKASVLLQNMKVSGEEEKLLAELSDALIPATDTPGAKDVYAHLFVLRMMDDCRGKEDQEKFMKGLTQFNERARKSFNQSFSRLTPAQRSEFLQTLDGEKDTEDELHAFYKSAKGLTVQAYVTSQYFMTKVHPYELVPARFHGCVRVDSVKKGVKA